VNKARDIIIHAHMKFWNNIYGIYRDCSDYNNKMDEFYRQIDECVGLHDEPLARAYSIVVAICRLQAEYRKKLVAHTYLPSFEVEKIPAMLEGLGIHDYNLDNIIERRVRPIIMNAEYVG
jgi:predicted AlkP superfamily phosphohydrolase/phosphomutase